MWKQTSAQEESEGAIDRMHLANSLRRKLLGDEWSLFIMSSFKAFYYLGR